MLKRSLVVMAALVAVFQANIASAEIKIGVYDARKILESLPSVQKEFNNLNAEFEPKKKDIADKTEKLQKLQDDIKKNAGTIYSDTELQSKQLEFQSKRRELQLLVEDTERLFGVRRNEAIRKFQSSVDAEVRKVAQEEGFDLILRSGVMYASPKVDITDQVLKRMSSK